MPLFINKSALAFLYSVVTENVSSVKRMMHKIGVYASCYFLRVRVLCIEMNASKSHPKCSFQRREMDIVVYLFAFAS